MSDLGVGYFRFIPKDQSECSNGHVVVYFEYTKRTYFTDKFEWSADKKTWTEIFPNKAVIR